MSRALGGLLALAPCVGAAPVAAAPVAAAQQAAAQQAAAQQADWAERWTALESLRQQEDSLLRYELSEDQRQLARGIGDSTPALEAFRIQLLGAALDQASATWGQAALPVGLEEGERRLALEFLPAGEGRASALVAELLQPDGTPRADLDPARTLQLQQLGFAAFVEEHDRFDEAAAWRLAEALHASAQATWSCFCVEGIARRTGDHDRARGVVRDQLPRAGSLPERIELHQRLAIAAAGAGEPQLELESLGRALRLGGSDGFQILGMTALIHGERLRARRLFGALLQRVEAEGGETPPWSLRGWGLSLLPEQGPLPLPSGP